MQTQSNSIGALLGPALGIAGAAALGAAGVVVGGAIYAVSVINGRPRPTFYDSYTFSPFETDVVGFETVSFPTEDGLRLYGWWLPRPGRPTIVIFAGHRSHAADMLGIGSGLWRAGYSVLLFDWRSRGRSDVRQYSLAYYERRDAEAALRYARSRDPQAPLGVVGFSMGAALALMLAARTPAIQAVVADSPFARMDEVVAYGVAQLGLPSAPVVALADRLNGLRHGYRFADVRPIDAVGALAPRPLLLTHGTRDSVIPFAHAEQIYAAAGHPKELWVFDGVDHCGGYFADRAAYVARVAAFFDAALAAR